MNAPKQNRVVLVSSGNRSGVQNIPLGLMSLATSMRRDHSIVTEILDLPIESPGNVEAQNALFWENVDMRGVLFVGFATVCGTIPRTLSLAKDLRRRFQNIPIVFGGPDASSHPQALIRAYSFIDMVVVGEGEGVLEALLDSLRSGKRKSRVGLCFKEDADEGFPGPAPLVDLGKIEPVDYSIYPPGAKDECVAFDIGRGCPFGCKFCSTKSFFRRNFRLKPAERILDEIAGILANPNVRIIEFIHDMFTANRKLVEEVCQGIIASGLTFEWTCSARTDCVDSDLLKLMYRAGCRDIYFGIDTASERLQREILKNLDLDDAEKTLALALRLGFKATAAVLIGFPNEEEIDLVDTLDFALRWGGLANPRLNVQVHMVTPMDGTDLAMEHGDDLLYDAYVGARMVVYELTEWEERQVRLNPQLFQSFYYCSNPHIPRSAYKWIHNGLTTGQINMGDIVNQAQFRGERPGRLLLQWAKSMPPYLVAGGSVPRSNEQFFYPHTTKRQFIGHWS